MKNRKGFTAVEGVIVVYFLVIVIGFGGYLANIYRMCKCDFKAPYKAEVIHGIGIAVPPVGAITGFISISDKPE